MNKEDTIRLGSIAEDLFIDIFSETFGLERTNEMAIQYPFVDIYGNNRFIDFAMLCNNEKIAVEIDGETYHNPNKVSNNKYYDDLLKQNSLIYQNWKLYRWTYKQLKDYREKVKDELITFLGELPQFKEIEDYLPEQKGTAFSLKEHQVEALENIKDMRSKGETIALLYHATGTGKTVTAVEDAKALGERTLFLSHTKELVNQAEEKFKELWSEKSCGVFMGDRKEKDKYIICATVQSITANIDQFNAENFGYIVVDEAHHGTAQTYQKILGFFKAKFILGLTATPERGDGEDLLDIFKNVAHKLDLKTAIEKEELVPIRCIRVKTNVDISSVRINGIKYNSQDLESKLFIPERNNVIVDTYAQYVKNKKAVVFCASVRHAEEIADLFKEKGIKAEAVSGSTNNRIREKTLKDYEYGDINVLCACDLLNEGWDSPRTEVLFMARPTMSKTIYMQQLGRGTRKCEGKEYLMVFDFIDNANLFNMSLSAHRLFNVDKYVPGAFILSSGKQRKLDEDLLRKGEKPEVYIDFPVNPSDYEYVDLFNWQDKVKDLISQIEFIRMVDVQSETIERYIREGKIKADFEVPTGTRSFKYFKEETIKNYAKEFGWDLINASNIKEKFMEFANKMRMEYSYKPVLLMGMLECTDENGKVLIEDLIDYFIDFYEDRKSKGLKVEKEKSIFNRESYTKTEVKGNIFSNPFKRFEDMRFMKKSKDIEYVEFNKHIWKKLSKEERYLMIQVCENKLEKYYASIN